MVTRRSSHNYSVMKVVVGDPGHSASCPSLQLAMEETQGCEQPVEISGVGRVYIARLPVDSLIMIKLGPTEQTCDGCYTRDATKIETL